MQFTPDIKERYAAALRNLIAQRVIKGENLQKNLRLLKIILIFSSLCRSEIKAEVNAFKSIEKLLLYASLKFDESQKILTYNIKGEQGVKIDYSILKLIILELVAAPTETDVNLKVNILKNRIILTVQNAKPSKILKCLVKKIKGVLIKEKAESNLAVMLPALCVLNYDNLTEDNEDYDDPFSSVNIMLFR